MTSPVIDRPGAGPAERDGAERAQVEEHDLVTHRAELDGALAHLDQPHRREAVGQVHRHQRDLQDDRERHAHPRHVRTRQDREPAHQLDRGGEPGGEERQRHAERVQRRREQLGPAAELCPAMPEEAVADDEAKQQGRDAVAQRRRERGVGAVGVGGEQGCHGAVPQGRCRAIRAAARIGYIGASRLPRAAPQRGIMVCNVSDRPPTQEVALRDIDSSTFRDACNQGGLVDEWQG